MYGWSWEDGGRRGPLFNPLADQSGGGVLSLATTPEAVLGQYITEQLLATGATIIDGPEYEGLSSIFEGRQTPAFENVVADIFRKIIDGTIRIPTRNEVLSRTKIAIANDVDDKITPVSLYTGLYAVDGEHRQNKSWLKKTGRYGTIPFIHNGSAEKALFETVVLQSKYDDRWKTEQDKINEFNNAYPAQYSGDIYAYRSDNRWLVYNPHLNADIPESGTIPFQYHSADQISLTFEAHTFAVIEENSDHLNIYLNNYRTDKDPLWAANPDGITWGDYFANYFPSFISSPTDDLFRTS